MKKQVFISNYDLITPLGNDIETNWNQLIANSSGIELKSIRNNLLPLASIKYSSLKYSQYTFIENLMIDSINKIITQSNIDITKNDFQLIISTTKGNIDLLKDQSNFPIERSRLGVLANTLQNHFHLKNIPIVVSNACVSGVMAVSLAYKYIQYNKFNKVIVCGADILSQFVLEGFLSFKAISNQLCKPFDINRSGINLGEAIATILLSDTKINESDVRIIGSASSNDANHISGPSRTGDGLALAIKSALKEAELTTHDIDFISAHGTATLYNDEMESKAIESLQLQTVPINSYKGYIGHTLGAAGVVEIIYSVMSMKNNTLIKSIGCDSTAYNINIINQNIQTEVNNCMKLSSGFGGCNAVIILSK